MSLVPILMRSLAQFAGCVSQAQVELFTQNAYFFFQVVQVFLIRTITDSASSVIIDLVQNPTSVFIVLSSSLPTSSNFYISYFIVQGLTIATSVLTQISGCIMFTLMYKYFTGTPRAMYNRWTSLSAVLWGSLLPLYTTIVVICVTYAVIAPVILFWATIALGLFYVAFRYNLLFVSNTVVDTQGLIYPRALKQLFTGIYLAGICMVGMFAVSKAIGPAILMAVFLVFSIIFQLSLNKSLDPLLYTLPRSLQVEEQIHQENLGDGFTNAEVSSRVYEQGDVLSRFFKPWIFADYWTLRKLVPPEDQLPLPSYDANTENNAYWPPSATSPVPSLWIPKDQTGLSTQEVAETGRVIPISNEGCLLNHDNKLVWDKGVRPPNWTERVDY